MAENICCGWIRVAGSGVRICGHEEANGRAQSIRDDSTEALIEGLPTESRRSKTVCWTSSRIKISPRTIMGLPPRCRK